MKLILLMCLLPIACYSQDKKDPMYISGSFGVDLPKDNHGLTGRLSFGGNIANTAFIGFGAGITKFDGMKSIFPLFLNLNFVSPKGRVFPAVLFQPGYGIYSHTVGPIKTTGGLTIYAGAGVGFRTSESIMQLNAGYTYYSFKTGTIKSTIDGLGLRLTIVGY